MGCRNPERDRLILSDHLRIIDWGRQYEGWAVLVACTAKGCRQQRFVHATEVLRMRNPPDTIERWKDRLVCGKCGSREFALHPRFVGERR